MKLKQVPLEQLNALNPGTLMEALDIRYLEVGDDFVKASMPVNERTKQPMGLLHGGASAALMETVGSLGSVLLTDPLHPLFSWFGYFSKSCWCGARRNGHCYC